MSAPTIIDAGPVHAAVLAALHAATVGADVPEGGEGWSEAWVARVLALPGAFAALALAPDPVGFATCLPAGEAVDLVAIGVLPEHRRAGIGRALLARCEAHVRGSGAQRLMLEVAAENEDARVFYAALGFAETGRRPGYYRAHPGGQRRDALVLTKSL